MVVDPYRKEHHENKSQKAVIPCRWIGNSSPATKALPRKAANRVTTIQFIAEEAPSFGIEDTYYWCRVPLSRNHFDSNPLELE